MGLGVFLQQPHALLIREQWINVPNLLEMVNNVIKTIIVQIDIVQNMNLQKIMMNVRLIYRNVDTIRVNVL